jgi:hypothetical protein
MTMKTEEVSSPSLAQISVEPCSRCAEMIRENSRRAGYEEGYEDGFDGGRAADDVPMAATFDLGYDLGYMACSNAWLGTRGHTGADVGQVMDVSSFCVPLRGESDG